MRGDPVAAIHYYTEAIAVARDIGNLESEFLYRSNRGGAHALMEAPEESREAERELRKVIEQAGAHAPKASSPHYFAETYRFLAEALIHQGRLAEALDAVQTSLRLGLATENQEHLAAAWRVQGIVLARLGKPPQANTGPALPSSLPQAVGPDECFDRCLGLLRAMGNEPEQARALRAWAHAERQCGRFDSAREHEAEADRILQQRGTRVSTAFPPAEVSP
jgi:tetratricopeptide (TPR) repeat protein